MTHICVSKLTIIGSDKGLSPDRRQAIIWTNAGILLIRTLGTNLSEILGEIHSFSFKKMHLKMSSAKGRLFSLGLNELSKNRHDSSANAMESQLFCMKPSTWKLLVYSWCNEPITSRYHTKCDNENSLRKILALLIKRSNCIWSYFITTLEALFD